MTDPVTLVIVAPVTGQEFRRLVYQVLDSPLFGATVRGSSREVDRLTVWYDVLGATIRMQCEITFGVKTERPVMELGFELQHPLNKLSAAQWGAVQEFTRDSVDLERHLVYTASQQEITDPTGLQNNWLH